MDRILGGIYVGSYQPLAVGVDLKGKYKITHILSVIKGELPDGLKKQYTVKQIEIDDEETTNILDFLNETNKFINEALYPKVSEPKVVEKTDESKKKSNGHRGAILIHCSQGVSRSVAFTIAYLMYKYKLSLQNSLYAVQRKRSIAQPNIGFMQQLKIYEDALQHNDYIIDKIDLNAEQAYRDWIFKNSMDDEEARNKFLSNNESYAAVAVNQNQHNPKEGEKLTQLRCKKCRQELALSTSFIPHEIPDEGSRQSNFVTTSGYSNRIIGIERASNFCSHIFVEPLNWMKEELQGKGELLGKLNCPNSRCGTKVGTYSWKGSRCSCGRWVVPAISLQTAKVDEVFISTHSNFEQIKRQATIIE
ncbi:tyrosine protein phosphatase [Saccharomycopsis crataegensis]|uniref:protein-tyrosine-phosphatase n=1 Tax=Saccharomycopsis crataegensis TaxID=43959 RepID=A0AAV5QQE5_9ASCO|nr:tyrosine protein phosphatase [Saccharomycopsis crataegensis]